MAVHSWKVASEAGAEWAASQVFRQVEVGEELKLDLSADQKRALVAAGWLEEPEKPQKEEKK